MSRNWQAQTRYHMTYDALSIAAANVATLTTFASTYADSAVLHGLQITASGLPTTTAQITVNLQGSLDSASTPALWSNIGGTVISSAGTYYIDAVASVKYIRPVINANTAGGAIQFTAMGIY